MPPEHLLKMALIRANRLPRLRLQSAEVKVHMQTEGAVVIIITMAGPEAATSQLVGWPEVIPAPRVAQYRILELGPMHYQTTAAQKYIWVAAAVPVTPTRASYQLVAEQA